MSYLPYLNTRAIAYCACSRCGLACLDITLLYRIAFLSPSLWEKGRYRQKCCLKEPLNSKQLNQPCAWNLFVKIGRVLKVIPSQTAYCHSSRKFIIVHVSLLFGMRASPQSSSLPYLQSKSTFFFHVTSLNHDRFGSNCILVQAFLVQLLGPGMAVSLRSQMYKYSPNYISNFWNQKILLKYIKSFR